MAYHTKVTDLLHDTNPYETLRLDFTSSFENKAKEYLQKLQKLISLCIPTKDDEEKPATGTKNSVLQK